MINRLFLLASVPVHLISCGMRRPVGERNKEVRGGGWRPDKWGFWSLIKWPHQALKSCLDILMSATVNMSFTMRSMIVLPAFM